MNRFFRCYAIRKNIYIVASELKDPICHSDECQIGAAVPYKFTDTKKQGMGKQHIGHNYKLI